MSAKSWVLIPTLVLALAAMASADQEYTVSGDDLYRIGQAEIRTAIDYSGTQTLTIARVGKETRFTAEVRYTRTDAAGSAADHASFEQVMTPGGELQDRSDFDPDYLTVLNQPFAVMLDPQTFSELHHLRGKLPFTFPAPMIDGTLHGYLQRAPAALVASRPALGVDFDAAGPMLGPIPDHAALSIAGTMRMRGTAYYAARGNALLLALRETLTISGTLREDGHRSPVTIVYRRTIKARPGSAF
jgi:hypothetical protein